MANPTQWQKIQYTDPDAIVKDSFKSTKRLSQLSIVVGLIAMGALVGLGIAGLKHALPNVGHTGSILMICSGGVVGISATALAGVKLKRINQHIQRDIFERSLGFRTQFSKETTHEERVLFASTPLAPKTYTVIPTDSNDVHIVMRVDDNSNKQRQMDYKSGPKAATARQAELRGLGYQYMPPILSIGNRLDPGTYCMDPMSGIVIVKDSNHEMRFTQGQSKSGFMSMGDFDSIIIPTEYVKVAYPINVLISNGKWTTS